MSGSLVLNPGKPAEMDADVTAEEDKQSVVCIYIFICLYLSSCLYNNEFHFEEP